MPKKIIVVDDSETIRQHLTWLLRGQGYHVVTAADGECGLDEIAAQRDVALVLCDISMPRRDGLSLLEEVQRRGGGPPFLMLTSESEPEMLQRARAAGARGWIYKPYKAEILVGTVRKIAGPP